MKILNFDDYAVTDDLSSTDLGNLISDKGVKSVFTSSNLDKVIAVESYNQNGRFIENRSQELIIAEYSLGELLHNVLPQHFPENIRVWSDRRRRELFTEKERIYRKLDLSPINFVKIMDNFGYHFASILLNSIDCNEDLVFTDEVNNTIDLFNEFFFNLQKFGINPFYNQKNLNPRHGIDFGKVDNFMLRADDEGKNQLVYVDTVYPFEEIQTGENKSDIFLSTIIDNKKFKNAVLEQKQNKNISKEKSNEIFSQFNSYLAAVRQANYALIP